MLDLGSLINETPIALSGRMVCPVRARLLCGMLAFLCFLINKQQMPPVVGWSAQQRHYCYVGFGFSYHRNTNCNEWPDGLQETRTSAMGDLGFLINETPIALFGPMVCTLQALLLRGICASL